MSQTTIWVPLTEAAQRLRMSYNRTLRLLHIGELEARKTDNGRWQVREDSLERLARQRRSAGHVTD